MDQVKTSFSIKTWSTSPESKPTLLGFGKKGIIFLSRKELKPTSDYIIWIAYRNYLTFHCYTKMVLRFQRLPKWKYLKSKKKSTQ